MMTDNLIIIFVKNNQPGQVKTRLAEIIGDHKASEVYALLVDKTLNCIQTVEAEKHIYFSSYLENDTFSDYGHFIQKGNDLGARMQNAFETSFNTGYQNVILIGSDLPDISAKIINQAYQQLKVNDIVLGPAEDGGYYLIGLSHMLLSVFKNKPWSQPNLLDVTLNELSQNNFKVALLETLNDIDTFEDLKQYPELLTVISHNG